MQKSEVVILQHVACEGPQAIGVALQQQGILPRLIRVDQGQPVPASLDGAAGLVVMGGPMGVYEAERFPHLRDEQRLIESALRAQRPVLGVCLGSQLLAATLGAPVYPGPQKEIGWYEVQLKSTASDDRLWQDLPLRFRALHWHGDVFDLPNGATSLARSQLTAHQAFRYGPNAYGLLFHLEITAAQVQEMVRTFADELAGAYLGPEAILQETQVHIGQAAQLGQQVFARFADLIEPQ